MVGVYSPTLSPWLAWTSYGLGALLPQVSCIDLMTAGCTPKATAFKPSLAVEDFLVKGFSLFLEDDIIKLAPMITENPLFQYKQI